MNKLFYFVGLLFIANIVFTACGSSRTADAGVEINGIRWATRNVDAPGTFAPTPESSGMLYQWNRNIGWSSSNPMVNSEGGNTWNSSVPTGTSWARENDPCPEGWRVPTQAELQSLVNAGSIWTTRNEVRGLLFGTAPNQIFLPAAGSRDDEDGTIDGLGIEGSYWSSEQRVSESAWGLFFSIIDETEVDWELRTVAQSVRCVAE